MKVVVIGGGVSGYMVANRLLSLHIVKEVVLISSTDIDPIGVGEGTAPDFLRYLKSAGIKEQDFMDATDSTYKYGVHYKGWWDTNFVNAFPLEFINQEELKEMSDSIIEGNEIKQKHSYGIHFDCNKTIQFLKEKAEANPKYSHIEGIASVNWEKDRIVSVQVGEETIEGKYFVNCAKAGLFNETYTPVNHYNNTAITCHIEGDTDMQYTEAMTMSAGWRWAIPLKGKTGYGYVFNNEYITEEEARTEFFESLDNIKVETRTIKYQSQYAEKAFGSNYATIGLAQNFLDPLDTLSLISTCFTIDWLVQYLLTGSLDMVNIKYRQIIGVFTSHLNSQYTHQKLDTAYWADKRKMNLKVYANNKPSSYTLLTYIGRGFL